MFPFAFAQVTRAIGGPSRARRRFESRPTAIGRDGAADSITARGDDE
jgi:hypothetical protein